jgi:hypothetical protein
MTWKPGEQNVAETYAGDLKHLRDLLDMHDMPARISPLFRWMWMWINLIQTLAGMSCMSKRSLRCLRSPVEPMAPDVAGKVYGCNYIVDDSGDLQGFEYTTIEGGPDLQLVHNQDLAFVQMDVDVDQFDTDTRRHVVHVQEVSQVLV